MKETGIYIIFMSIIMSKIFKTHYLKMNLALKLEIFKHSGYSLKSIKNSEFLKNWEEQIGDYQNVRMHLLGRKHFQFLKRKTTRNANVE